MSRSWLDLHGPGGERRVTLLDGRTRLGGSGSDVVLEGVTGGELHVWSDPPRALYVPSSSGGTPPLHEGRPFRESPLRPGTRLVWGLHELVFGAAAPAGEAELEELFPDRSSPEVGSDPFLRLGRRVAAGVLCEAGMADRKVQKRWQDAVESGAFDPDACARELLPTAMPATLSERLLGRGGTLLRDFLMASRQRGLRGAARHVRQKTRSAVAFVLVQAAVFVLFTLILAACMLVLRMHRGVSFDAWLDRVLGPG